MKKSYFIIFAILLVSTLSIAKNKPETIKLNGTAYEESNGIEKPLAFAYVFIENSTTCTYTDCNGAFNLELPRGKQKISISFKGYDTAEKTVTIKNTNSTALKMVLISSNNSLTDNQ